MTSDRDIRYGVGWTIPFGKELEDFKKSLRDYSIDKQTHYMELATRIEMFGRHFPLSNLYPTPENAQWMLEQIKSVNSADNLKMLCGGGERLFVITATPRYPERAGGLWDALILEMYEHVGPLVAVCPPGKNEKL